MTVFARSAIEISGCHLWRRHYLAIRCVLRRRSRGGGGVGRSRHIACISFCGARMNGQIARKRRRLAAARVTASRAFGGGIGASGRRCTHHASRASSRSCAAYRAKAASNGKIKIGMA
jgi:hypothetical protein